MSNSTIEIPRDQTLDYFQVACAAISIFSSAEVLGLAFTTFARYNTLYFNAIVGCATGCILFAGGFVDLFYKLFLHDGVTAYRPLFILTFGWYMMVTGFSLVMYSRLHLVSVPKQYIQMIKYFIIYNVIFSHFPTTVLTFGSFLVGSPQFVQAYSIMEKLQMTMFCIQEMTLGTLYLIYTRKLRFNKKENYLVRQTLYINCVVLMLDFAMLIIQYIDLYNYQIMLKVVVYAVKLKLEFFILNLLSRFLQKNRMTSDGGRGNYAMSDHTSAKHGGKEIAPAALSDVELGKEKAAESLSDSQTVNVRE
jgi:hypothetical protein